MQYFHLYITKMEIADIKNRRMAQFNRDYGRHSLIPECCIEFYITEWHPFFETKWRHTAYNDMLDASPYNYVPCVDCFFSGQIVKIRLCQRDCGRDCVEDYL
jgi:hypothetical protein